MESIPEAWINAVVRILRTGAIDREIQITLYARQSWEAATMGWSHELIDAIKNALEVKGVLGNRVADMCGPGETYEFWIFHNSKQLYAKVCLLKGEVKVNIISAHTPRKGLQL